MKNEQRIYKNEFGSFCSQFGFNQKKTKPPLSNIRNKQAGNLVRKYFITTREVLMEII